MSRHNPPPAVVQKWETSEGPDGNARGWYAMETEDGRRFTVNATRPRSLWVGVTLTPPDGIPIHSPRGFIQIGTLAEWAENAAIKWLKKKGNR